MPTESPISPLTIILVALLVFAFIIFVKMIRIVPQKHVFIVERLGKYAPDARGRFPHPRPLRRRSPTSTP